MASRPVKLKLLPRSTMKAKVATRLAGQVVAGTGITVVKAGGVFTVSADYGAGIFQLADSDLTALANNTTNGLWTITASGAGAARTLTGTANEITITNGDGVSGNPTFSLPSAITLTGKTLTGGIFVTPTINTPASSGGTVLALTSFGLRSTGAAFDLKLAATEVLTADRTLTLVLGNQSRTLSLAGNITTASDFNTSGAFGLTLTTTATTNVTLPTTGTLATLLGIETLQNKTLLNGVIQGGSAAALTTLSIKSSGAAFNLGFATSEAITANRTLNLVVNDADKTINLGGNIQTGGALQTGGAFTTSGASALTLTTSGATNVTLPTTGTLATLAGSEALSNKTLTSPTINSPAISGGTALALTGLGIRSTGAAFDIKLAATEALTADRTLTLVVNDGNKTINLGGNVQTAGAFQTAGAASLPAIVQGDLWYGSAAGTISALAKSTSTSRFLKNSGTSNNPAWAQPAASDLSDGTTGSGSVVLATTPTLVTPVLGVATATSINKVALTAPATAATLTIANNKTLTVSNTLTFTGTDSTSFAFPSTSDTVATLGAVQTLSQTTAQNLALTGTVSGANTIPYSILAQGNGLSVLGVAGSSTANIAGIVGTANQVLRVNSAGTTLGFGAINLASSAAVTGVLPIANFTTGTPTGAKFVRDDGVLATPAGAGDFVGPGSATDNAAVRFDGTTGKLGQDSALLIADTTGSLSRSGNGGIPVQGSNTNDSAAAGYMGEYTAATARTAASPLSISTDTATNVLASALSLTAGDWDVFGTIGYIPASATVVRYMEGSISSTSATRNTTTGQIARIPVSGATGTIFDATGPIEVALPVTRISIASTTSIYLVGYTTFGTSTMTVYGTINARRVR